MLIMLNLPIHTVVVFPRTHLIARKVNRYNSAKIHNVNAVPGSSDTGACSAPFSCLFLSTQITIIRLTFDV